MEPLIAPSILSADFARLGDDVKPKALEADETAAVSDAFLRRKTG